MNESTEYQDMGGRSVRGTDERSRKIYAGIICALGVGFASFHVPHFFADMEEGMGTAALVSGALLPFLLSVVLIVGGYWAWKEGVGVSDLRRLVLWTNIGIISLIVISGAYFTYNIIEGGVIPHMDYMLLNFATTGAVVGIGIGWYDVRGRTRMRQLRVFRKAVEHAGHSIYLTSPDGTIEYVNPAFESKTGFSQEEVLGKNARVLKSGKQDESYYEELWETILSAEVWDDELINQRKDGSYCHVHQTIAPVTDSYDNIDHFVAINTDITEMKEYEAELERQNDRLDKFASVISHDLRNPLNVAMARTEMARNGDDNEHLDAVTRSLERMETLIGDVLALARQGESISETTRVSLSSMSREAWKQIAAPEATLSVETDTTILADDSRLQQLFENLFRNSVEHGGEAVTIRVISIDDGLAVEDDGTGFAQTELDSIFESGHTTSTDGTGLGLAIVEQIVEAHGWEIQAVDADDGGARFEITGVETESAVPPTPSADEQVWS